MKQINPDGDNFPTVRNAADFKQAVESNRRKFKQGLKENPLFTRNDNGRMVIDHAATANAMVKFIMACPIDPIIKSVMVMRIGYPLKNKKPVSYTQIAIRFGMTLDEVKDLENIGKIVVADCIDRISQKDAIEKFNKDKIKLNAELGD